ncbi:MAG: MotA/TolQ/ExbB proton channel family protein, partial [Pseudomonadota bacterium]|nr:MotA/TolQ/ExbB proton channel family protein [Pseudomonadota bacterium]
MLELIKAGGWPMIPLLLLSLVGLGIIVERFWTLRRKAVLPPGLGEEVRAWAARGKLDPAHIDSLRGTSPLGELLAAALDVRNRPRDQIRERIEDVGRHLVHRMERFLNTLGTIAAAGPLLGLFGTVVG